VVNIKVLGPGCANCKRLEQIAQKAVESLSIEAQIEKVTDYAEIMALGVMATPGLVINDKVVSSGRIPAEIEVLDWLSAAAS
jgi:small redox-active disulfide protein 2